MFERLFLASLALGVLAFVLSYEIVMAALANEPSYQQAGLGSGVVIGLVAGVYAICLLLWHLIANRGANAAKWILTVLVILDVLSALPALARTWDTMLLLSVTIRVLEVAAVVYLFRPDAVAWLKGTGAAEPATLD
jgi:hypothetical protein